MRILLGHGIGRHKFLVVPKGQPDINEGIWSPKYLLTEKIVKLKILLHVSGYFIAITTFYLGSNQLYAGQYRLYRTYTGPPVWVKVWAHLGSTISI